MKIYNICNFTLQEYHNILQYTTFNVWCTMYDVVWCIWYILYIRQYKDITISRHNYAVLRNIARLFTLYISTEAHLTLHECLTMKYANLMKTSNDQKSAIEQHLWCWTSRHTYVMSKCFIVLNISRKSHQWWSISCEQRNKNGRVNHPSKC